MYKSILSFINDSICLSFLLDKIIHLKIVFSSYYKNLKIWDLMAIVENW